MNRTYWIFGIFCLWLAGSGCEEAVEWELQPGNNGQLAVEAIVTDELHLQTVELSLTFDELNGTPRPVSGAVVSLQEEQQSIPFVELENEPGTYQSEQSFAAKPGISYRLEINWNEQLYEAESQMVEILPIPGIEYDTIGQDSLKIKGIGPLFDTLEQAWYEIEIDWNHLIPLDTSQAIQYFYTFSTIDVSELIRPVSEEVAFPKGSILRIKKYALNDDYAAYLRAFLLETAWQGGVYDENSSSLPTNISNGGGGFFAVAAVLRDTVVAE